MTRAEALRWTMARAPTLDAAGTGNPFLLAAWTRHFLEQVAEDNWNFAAAESADGGGMLLYSLPQRPRHWLALANYYTSLWGPTLAPGSHVQPTVDRLVGQITEQTPSPVAVQLAPLSAEADTTAALQTAFAARHWHVKRYFCFGNWFLRSEGLAFDDFMAQRESRLVNTWKRKAKRFTITPGAGTRVEIVTGSDGVEDAVAAYEQIYAKSWKQPEPYARFVGDWARICAREGWLRMGLAWVDGQPIAAQFWFTVARRAYIFKLAYDEAFANWSAGTVLSAALFRHSLDVDRVVEIDYLTGDDAYKKTWMTERRERVGLLACNLRTPAGLLLAGREQAAGWWRRWR